MQLLSLDLSLSNSGGCVFNIFNGKPIYVFSIPTNSKQEHRERLKIIGDKLVDVKQSYDISLVVFEKGFSRFEASTQAIFKVVGVASYIFANCQQEFYAPSTIKKVLTGNGKADKSEVENMCFGCSPI
jgi:crossover junction endodeoxyribonuclease RuvC